jgi:hypothetical protein
MKYAIIRNRKYTMDKLNLLYRHNERRNKNYSNREININCHDNFSIKKCNNSYVSRLNQMIKENELTGRILKNSNVVCEYVISSSREFFDDLSIDEIKKFFKTSYRFVCNYKDLGEENIVSAVVHMDETKPHMHLVYLPVVHKMDEKSGKRISKLCCTDFWKERFSYKKLQDDYYNYMTRSGYKMDRGESTYNKSLDINAYKMITKYEVQKYNRELLDIEYDIKAIDIDKETDIDKLKEEYKRVIKGYNKVANKYSKIKTISEAALEKIDEQVNKTSRINKENSELKERIDELENYISKALECISIMFDFPEERLVNVINGFMKGSKEKENGGKPLEKGA